jgi:hypothetical protein
LEKKISWKAAAVMRRNWLDVNNNNNNNNNNKVLSSYINYGDMILVRTQI